MKKLSIVVPCFNEEKNIPLILDRFRQVIRDYPVEVILVNNGSTDNSQAVLDRLLPKYRFARTVRVKVNRGYGFGILTGLKAAKGDYLGWTHADMQTDPNDVVRAYEILKSRKFPEQVFLKGRRRGRPLFDTVFTVGMSLFESVYLGRVLWDINAQPNIFPKSFLPQLDKAPHDFSLDLYVLYTAAKLKMDVIRFDVVFPERIHGTSSWNTGLASKWKFIKRTLEFSTRLKKELR